MSMEFTLCPECGVPETFTQEHLWLNNGEFVQSAQPDARLAFLECENFDPVYRNIGEIIGMPIEHIVIDITARGLQYYLSSFVPQELKDLLGSMKPGDKELEDKCHRILEELIPVGIMVGKINGTGRYEVKDFRYQRCETDFSRIWIYDPYSIPFVVGGLMGQIRAMLGIHNEVEYHQISPYVWELKSHPVPIPSKGQRARMPLESFVHKDGDIELERCPSCGGPSVLSRYRWNLDRGIISSTITHRRMAVLGPTLLDALFDELEYELGDVIPQTVVEAQRRFVKTGFYSIEEVRDVNDMRLQLALRGLGNLKEIDISPKGVRTRIDNAILHLMIVGLVQGLFEMAFSVESTAEWELSEDGDLTLEITPR
jgi:hypothetical protein